MKRLRLVALISTSALLAACGASEDSQPSEITTQASFSTAPSELNSGSPTGAVAAAQTHVAVGVENLQQQLDNKVAELVPRGFPEDRLDMLPSKAEPTLAGASSVGDAH